VFFERLYLSGFDSHGRGFAINETGVNKNDDGAAAVQTWVGVLVVLVLTCDFEALR